MGTLVLSLVLIGVSVLLMVRKAPLVLSKSPVLGRLLPFGMLALGGIIFLASIIKVIDAGEVAVVVIFGNVEKKVLTSGINIVPPYADVVRYSVRIREHTQAENSLIEARVNNGLNVRIDCTTLYRLDPSMAVDVYSKIATSLEDLEDKILVPTLRTVIRNVISRYNSEEVYSSKRELVSLEIENNLRQEVSNKGIYIDKFLVRGIKLPAEIDNSIQLKISSQQEAEAMQYKKQKAQQEAEIRIIEAEGLAKAQRIINSTLTPFYLQHEAIQAYRELAGSENTTFVILPTSPNSSGMPLILNGAK